MISVIVPVYAEETNIRPFLARTVPVLERIGTYEIIFALDPSPDGTELVVRDEIARNPNIGLMVFSRRFGQPAATWRVSSIVAADGAPSSTSTCRTRRKRSKPLWRKAQEGFDVVTARRATREGETVVKRMVAWLGYGFINKVAEVPIPRNTGEFRVISRRVIEELRSLNETHAFLKGLVPFVGFAQTEILYDRDARAGGRKIQPLLRFLHDPANGIFGFSTFRCG